MKHSMEGVSVKIRRFAVWIGKNIASGLVVAVTATLGIFGIVYALSYPGSAPSGEVDGGKFRTELNRIWNALTIDGSNNVGVGKTPARKLDVEGAVNGTSLCINGDCRSSWSSVGGTHGTQEFTSNGNFVVPAGVGLIFVKLVWGGGGGGGGSDFSFYRGAGGSAGVSMTDFFAVTPGSTISAVVGWGGAGGTTDRSVGYPGANGGTTSFNGLSAPGGVGGISAASADMISYVGLNGAASAFGSGGVGGQSQGAYGGTASALGAGGGGGAACYDCMGSHGGNGGPGKIVIVW